MKDLAGRAQADLQNAKDRLASEAENMRKFATLSILSELLPIVDNLQRAFAHLPEELKDNDWVKGIEATEKDLMKKLSEAGIKKIESLGNPVDSEKHEVLQTGPGEKGEIIEVFEEGYECNGRILRPAKVKVGDGS
jgi:molecular chaperone GrpE